MSTTPSIVPMKLCDPRLCSVNSLGLCVTDYFGRALPCPRLSANPGTWSCGVVCCKRSRSCYVERRRRAFMCLGIELRRHYLAGAPSGSPSALGGCVFFHNIRAGEQARGLSRACPYRNEYRPGSAPPSGATHRSFRAARNRLPSLACGSPSRGRASPTGNPEYADLLTRRVEAPHGRCPPGTPRRQEGTDVGRSGNRCRSAAGSEIKHRLRRRPPGSPSDSRSTDLAIGVALPGSNGARLARSVGFGLPALHSVALAPRPACQKVPRSSAAILSTSGRDAPAPRDRRDRACACTNRPLDMVLGHERRDDRLPRRAASGQPRPRSSPTCV